MENNGGNTFDRRAALKTSAMALGGLVLAGERTEAFPRSVNTNSGPSKLKITDLRVATVVKPGPSPCPLIRIDTDQGVYGLGEVRDGASATYALFLKSGTPGTVTNPTDLNQWEANQLPHPLLGMEVTDKGITMLEQYVAAVRDAVGMEIPLSMDHLGHLGVKSIIRLGKAYEKYNLSWIEDVIPWNYTDLLKQISEPSPTPILTGEDIYLKEPFQVLCEKHAVSKIHPDLATSGGILETHKIGDIWLKITRYRWPCTLRGTPWWSLLVEEGTKTPIVNHGWIDVPDKPGLGVTLNESIVRQHLAPGTGYFESTSYWDHERSWDRLWS